MLQQPYDIRYNMHYDAYCHRMQDFSLLDAQTHIEGIRERGADRKTEWQRNIASWPQEMFAGCVSVAWIWKCVCVCVWEQPNIIIKY